MSDGIAVWANVEQKVAVVQQRAPAVKRHNQEFAQSVIDFFVKNGCKDLILLNSTEAVMRRERQLSGSDLCLYLSDLPQTSAQIRFFQ